MDRIVVRGGRRLEGEVWASGSKNATLALMAASLLTDGETVLRNVPRVRDVLTMMKILEALGVRCEWDAGDEHVLRIHSGAVSHPEAPYDLVRQMRASFLVLGPLVARLGSGRVSEPGGCAIGVRPVDQHLKGLEALGAKIRLDHGYVEASAARLRGAHVAFDMSTVNGTQNVMMAAVLAEGRTVIENAAREPEVAELAQLLTAMGARVHGAGTDRIEIEGVARLTGVDHSVWRRSHRSGHAARRGHDHARRGVRARRRRGAARRHAREAARRRRRGHRERRRDHVARRRAAARDPRRHGAVPRFPDRHAGAADGGADARGRLVGGDRDRLREPLHARPRAGAHGRRHRSDGPRRARARRAAAVAVRR